jgi:hypothetical protein
MARHANVEWNLPEGTPIGNGTNRHSWDSIHAATLMDIRDELKRLNRLLHCHNFTSFPAALRAIRRNTEPKPKRARRKAKR